MSFLFYIARDSNPKRAGGGKDRTMIYGYARCSTNETKQEIQRQVREAFLTIHCKRLYLLQQHSVQPVC